MNVGIVNLRWMLSFHNTDKAVLDMFEQISRYSDLTTVLLQSTAYDFSFNINKAINKCFSITWPNVRYSLHEQMLKCDVVYHYGTPSNCHQFFRDARDTPSMITTGFMSDEYVNKHTRRTLNRQLEADDIATKLSKASILHFHTVCGRERFLQYRPEFESRSISIPFFLPYLTQDAKDRNDTSANDEIVILFVGYDGIRKGITDLIKSINRLGDQFIKSYSLRFIVVTRDRPQCDVPIEWYSKLPRERVLDFMKMADIFVLVPDRESYGLVIIEAMNAGCAVIVDDDVTRKEIVGDAGVFVSPGNVEMLTEAIGLLVKDQTLRQRMQAAAMDRVRTVFLPATVGRQYENAFKTLV